MQRERPMEPCQPEKGPDLPAGDDPLAEARTKLGGILAAADRALDTIRTVNAEEFLQQNRQRGAQ